MLGPCIGFFETAEAVNALGKGKGGHDLFGGVHQAVVISRAGDVFADGLPDDLIEIYERLFHRCEVTGEANSGQQWNQGKGLDYDGDGEREWQCDDGSAIKTDG